MRFWTKPAKLLLVALLFPSIGASVVYAGSDAGRNSAAFLQINPSAYSSGMGSSGVAFLPDVPTALSLNPAGLEKIVRQNIYFTHHSLFEDINQEYLSYALPLGPGVAGLGINYLDFGDINRTTLSDPFGGIGTFSGNDLLVQLSYASRIFPYWSLGGSMKFVREKLESVSSGAFAIDLGMLWNTPVDGLDMGFSVQNVGSNLKFDLEDEDLPATARFGLALRTLENRLNFSLDLAKEFDDDEIGVLLGGEFWVARPFALRLGFDSRQDGAEELTLGFGIRYSDFTLDYAFIPKNDLEATYRVSASVSFGRERDRTVRSRSKDLLDQQLKQSSRKYFPKKSSTPEAGKQDAKTMIRDQQYAVSTSEKKFTPPVPEPSLKPVEEPRQVKTLEEYINEGELLFYRGDIEDALKVFEEAAGIYPSSFRIFYNLGTCYYTLKRYESALEAYKNAINLRPRSVDAHLYLGFTYLKLYEVDRAIKEWEVVLDLDPANEIARNNIEALSEY